MQRLLHFPDGSFLVRLSSKPHCFSLDLVTRGGNFLPLLVQRVPEAGPEAVRLVASPESGLESRQYASLAAMVEANRHVLRMPCENPAAAAAAAAAAARPAHAELQEEEEAEAPLREHEQFNVFATAAARSIDSGAPKLRREGSEEGEMLMASGGVSRGGKNKREGDEECQFLMDRPDI
jgi:hypothetical protein